MTENLSNAKDAGTAETVVARRSSHCSLPSPFYEKNGITIYHDDCLWMLQALRDAGTIVDAVVTDVPYASGARTEAKKSSSGAMLRGQRWAEKPIENDQMTTPGFMWFLREIASAVRPMLIEGGSFFTFIDWRQWPNLVGAVESVNLRVNQMVVWDKESYGLGNGFRSQHELGLHASKGTPSVHDHGFGNVLRCKRDANSLHPSPKPERLMMDILRVVSPDDGLIVDPCMGCGPVLRACMETGRRCIGIEIEERYCEIAAKRLAQGMLF